MSLLLTVLLVNAAQAEQESADKADTAGQAVACRCYESGDWRILETDNFRICSRSHHLDLDDLPARCERLRSRITRVWLDDADPENWKLRCDVIVHASLSEYQRTLGTSVGRSVGCATMKVDGGRIVSRRIDIRVDADAWDDDALPHELTHVVLADHFNGRRLPPWADEGIGVLSESRRKQQIRANAFRESASRGYVYQPSGLLSLRQFPAAGYREAFYAQSAALVQELVDRSSHREFIRCVEDTLQKGETAALASAYDIHLPDELNGITNVRSVTQALSHESMAQGKRTLIAAMDE